MKPTGPRFGGVIHTYRGYDPQRFPLPSAEPPDLVSPAFGHLLTYGSLRHLTEAELADAIELDPSQVAGLGPSLSELLATLEERKRKILETYEVESVRGLADQAYRRAASRVHPTDKLRAKFGKAVEAQQISDLERLWYQLDERSEFARRVLGLIERLGDKYQIEDLAAKYAFSGRRGVSIERALELKDELETIDRLIEQLKEAAKNAKLHVINLDELARFVDEERIEGLEALRRQVEELLRHLAEEQGLTQENGRYTLTPKAFKLFQSKLLDKIFADLQAAKTGRHHVEISGEGVVELPKTRPYEFGDSLANLDLVSSLTNAMVRGGPGLPIRLSTQDLEVHVTRNVPKCATVVCMDMSGSMRWGGQYVNVKRMALALHGLIRTEYPGDFVDFVEVYTVAKRRHISEVPTLLPKPVTIHESFVRLKADLGDERLTERDLPPHFTNLQQGLALARRLLQAQDTPNRQIILITDGLPTAHFEDRWLYLLYPPDRRTEHHTLREGLLCRSQGISINVFLLSGGFQTEEDIRFAHRLAEGARGRVFFVGGSELDRFVIWDYVRRRRHIVA